MKKIKRSVIIALAIFFILASMTGYLSFRYLDRFASDFVTSALLRLHKHPAPDDVVLVMIDEKYDGLIHISEISKDYVKDINDYVNVDDMIYAEVIDYDEEAKKYKLSIKNINYKDGSKIEDENANNEGFLPLKEHLDLWMNEKIKEIMDKM